MKQDWLYKAEQAAQFLLSRTSLRPRIGLVLGSGLGAFADDLADAVRIPYAEIPFFPRSTAVGHAGTMVLGLAGSIPVATMQGRVHLYEGYSAQEAIGRNVSMLMLEPGKTQHDAYLQHFRDTGEERIVGIPTEVVGLRKDDSSFPMSLAVSIIARDSQTTFIGIIRDLTQHQLDMEEIRQLAFYDPLTHLPNRRLLMDRMSQAMLTSIRTGQHGAVMFLDLDHFKVINDSLGHDVGDMLLQQ